MPSTPYRPQARPALNSLTHEKMESPNENNCDTTNSNGSSDNSRDTTFDRPSNESSPGNLNNSSAERHSLSKNFKQESYRSKPKTQGSNSFLCTCIFALLGVLLAIVIYLYMPSSEKKCTYKGLSKVYPSQDTKMWNAIATAVENILNKRETAPVVNLFIHQGGKDMDKLVHEIAEKTSKCFGGNLVEITENDFTSADVVSDYGHAVDTFKNKIKNGRVAFIVNLNKIPPKAARALHTICDIHTPVAEDIVIFLTLVTAETKGNPVAHAENTLHELWGSKLSRNELDPLITRVTDQVFALKPLN